MKTQKEWTRNCPKCNKVLTYARKGSRDACGKGNRQCASCRNSGENNPFYGKHHTDEHKQSIKNRVVSKKTRRKIGDASRGRHHSEDAMVKIREAAHNQFYGPNAQDNRQRTSEAIKAFYSGAKGKKRKAAIRQRNREYQVRRRQTPEYKYWASRKTEYELYKMEVMKITYENDLRQLENYSKKNLYHKYELDHIYPIRAGFKNGIPVRLIGHIDNLRVITMHENRSKNGSVIAELVPSNIQEFISQQGVTI